MLARAHSWLADIALDDPIEQRQAVTVQVVLIALLGISLLGFVFLVFSPLSQLSLPFTLARYGPVFVCLSLALVLLRRRRFQSAILLVTLGMLAVVSLSLAATGIRRSDMGLIGFIMPLTLAGLLAGRRVLLLIATLTIMSALSVLVLEQRGSALVGFLAPEHDPSRFMVTVFALIIIMLAVFYDRFRSSLRVALLNALSREQELEQIRVAQAATIETRTASLQQALQAVEQREQHLSATLEQLRASQQTVREMSAPVVPLLEGVLVAPLIGDLDESRARHLMQNVLDAVSRQHARHVIFDVTGVPVVDTQVAQVLLQTTEAVKLLGARALLVGIRPEVAQTVVSLGLDMRTLTTYSDLQEAISRLLALHERQPSRSPRQSLS